jgi:hypothetical protein
MPNGAFPFGFSGRLAQRKSTSLTWKGSVVRSHYRPPVKYSSMNSRILPGMFLDCARRFPHSNTWRLIDASQRAAIDR